MTTLQYILAWAGFCVACVACYAVGYSEGRKQGELDGDEDAADKCRRRCANARRSADTWLEAR